MELMSQRLLDFSKEPKITRAERAMLEKCVQKIKAWELHCGLTATPPPPDTIPMNSAICGLCGHDGIKVMSICPECGGRW